MRNAVLDGFLDGLFQHFSGFYASADIVDKEAVVPQGLVFQETAAFADIFVVADVVAGDNQF